MVGNRNIKKGRKEIRVLDSELIEIHVELEALKAEDSKEHRERYNKLEDRLNNIYTNLVPELNKKFTALENRVNIWAVITGIASVVVTYLTR